MQSELSSAVRMGPLLFSHSLVNPIKITQFEHLPSFLCCVVNKILGYDICIYILHNILTFGIWIVVDLHSNVLRFYVSLHNLSFCNNSVAILIPMHHLTSVISSGSNITQYLY